MASTTTRPPLARATLTRHLLRGLVGLLCAVAAVLLVGPLGPAALVLLLGAPLAWRGCPTCWLVGLAGVLGARRGK